MRTRRRRADGPNELAGVDDLSLEEQLELTLGPLGSSVFESHEEREGQYWRHRTALRELVNPETRPWSWWKFESPDGKHPPESNEEKRLEELGELTEMEATT